MFAHAQAIVYPPKDGPQRESIVVQGQFLSPAAE
jgi:hypothetical protein